MKTTTIGYACRQRSTYLITKPKLWFALWRNVYRPIYSYGYVCVCVCTTMETGDRNDGIPLKSLYKYNPCNSSAFFE